MDEAGKWHLRAVRITEGAAHIASPSDPEARWSKKRATEGTGYKVHLSQTCEQDLPHLFVAVHTTPRRRRPGRRRGHPGCQRGHGGRTPRRRGLRDRRRRGQSGT